MNFASSQSGNDINAHSVFPPFQSFRCNRHGNGVVFGKGCISRGVAGGRWCAFDLCPHLIDTTNGTTSLPLWPKGLSSFARLKFGTVSNCTVAVLYIIYIMVCARRLNRLVVIVNDEVKTS